MQSRRKAILYMLVLAPTWASVQAAQGSAESQLRSSVDAYLAAWSRRDVNALLQLHTTDTLYIDPNLNEKRGREQLAVYIGATMRLYDLRLDIERIVVRPDGKQALVILRERYGELPRKDGRYVRDYVARESSAAGAWKTVSGASSSTSTARRARRSP